jgi:polysaccharide deacetylase family protein (PEP-CTERM system associated)
VKNILTFDVEDWFEGLDPNPEKWSQYEARVERSTEKILEILAQNETRATFFFLGYIANRYPDLVRTVYNLGHEVGVHGYFHRLIYRQTRDEFKVEVLRTKELLEGITGNTVAGFRAPYFSITKSTLWALDILAELGFTYDSSIFPIYNHRYGIPHAKRNPHRIICTNNLNLVEFPISTFRFLGTNCPFSGGIYFRLLGHGWISRGIKSLNSQGWPAVVYLHPWEFDPDQPRYTHIPFTLRLRHYYALDKTAFKIDQLLKKFIFGPMGEFVNEVQ